MKIVKLILVLILAIKAFETAEALEDEQSQISRNIVEEADAARDQSTKTSSEVVGDKEADDEDDEDEDDEDDDVVGRHLKQIQLYTNDKRCNEMGVCSGMDYGDKGVVVTFSFRLEIQITSTTTYEVREPTNYYTLTFVNSKFANFPLQLFYAFKIKELDFRNCALATLKWDNFIGADQLSILLLSENRLSEIKPSLFSLAENLSFLFLDSNRISVLYNDSFKGLEKLNYLDLHNNRLEILPTEIFRYMPALQQINLAQNRIQVIEQTLFTENRRLFGIHLQQNALRQIQDYAFQNQNGIIYLDISHNSQLEVLVVDNFRVENLWAKNCSLSRVNIYGAAVHVDLQQNSIKELYFSQPEYLETLYLQDNALEQVSSLDLNNNLRVLDLSNNPQLKTLPDLWQINALERLDLSNTSLQKIPTNILVSPNCLKFLNVSHNQIEEINPLNFKYLQQLTRFYIHHNNWNCYNLQMLTDMVIKPLKISYTFDEYDRNFPGEYINGIKCMYRIAEPEPEDATYLDTIQEGFKASASSSATKQEYQQLNSVNTEEVEELRREFKAIVGIYEEKFSLLINKLNEMDLRLKEFERFNRTMWQQVSIVV